MHRLNHVQWTYKIFTLEAGIQGDKQIEGKTWPNLRREWQSLSTDHALQAIHQYSCGIYAEPKTKIHENATGLKSRDLFFFQHIPATPDKCDDVCAINTIIYVRM